MKIATDEAEVVAFGERPDLPPTMILDFTKEGGEEQTIELEFAAATPNNRQIHSWIKAGPGVGKTSKCNMLCDIYRGIKAPNEECWEAMNEKV